MTCKFRSRTVANMSAAAALIMAAGLAQSPAAAEARKPQSMKSQSVPAVQDSLSGPPVMAIVSIKHQRVSLYDAHGGALRASTSSGAREYETPVGIYSVLQKNRDHYSNLYDDAAMPFMQRITWSGIALHEGQLPGYPASHGCVRMPGTFAEQIFPLTKIGMRVIVARDNVAPVAISHSNLLKPAPISGAAFVTRTAFDASSTADQSPRPFVADLSQWPERQAEMDDYQRRVVAANTEVEQRKAPIAQLKEVVAAATKKQAAAAKSLRTAEKSKRIADERAASADRALAYAKDVARLKPWEAAKDKADAAVLTTTERHSKAIAAVAAATDKRARTRAERAERAAARAKQTAIAKASRADRDLAAAKLPARYQKQADATAKATATAATVAQRTTALLQAKQFADAALQTATQDLAKAEAALETAVAAATEARRKTLPVSLFISRNTQRLYVRQGHEPVVDVPVSIADPDKPIGTHVFTAVDYENGTNSLRWTAVSMAPRPGRDFSALSSKARKQMEAAEAEPFVTDAAIAASVLDRITIPPEILQRISASVWPGSSLIVSDEPLHKETNNATDFIVLISGEPQGGIKHRPKPPPAPARRYYDRDDWDDRPNDMIVYDRYGRRMRVIQKKPLFSWW